MWIYKELGSNVEVANIFADVYKGCLFVILCSSLKKMFFFQYLPSQSQAKTILNYFLTLFALNYS